MNLAPPGPARVGAALAFLLGAVRLGAADFQIVDAAEFARCAPAGAQVTKLAGGFQFVEGPVWLPAAGVLVFSDIRQNEMKQWSPAAGVATFRAPSFHANGNTLDRAGRLLTCEHSGRRVSRLEHDGTLRTVVDAFEGRRFNSPNDIVERSDGTLYFTDPTYGLKTDPATKQRVGQEQPGQFVFRHDPRTGRTDALVRDFVQPNGLAFSPDERVLYVADTGAPRHIRRFAVAADGSLSGGEVFYAMDAGVPDGLRVDAAGRVWTSARDGVHILAPSGALIGKILVPESPANLCFGGLDGKTLFITARTSLYAIDVAVTGEAR